MDSFFQVEKSYTREPDYPAEHVGYFKSLKKAKSYVEQKCSLKGFDHVWDFEGTDHLYINRYYTVTIREVPFDDDIVE